MKDNKFDRSRRGVGRIVSNLETPIIYAMAIVSSVIGIVVWGATKSGRPDSGLLSQFKSVFGTEYGLLFMACLISILFANRRWKGIVVVAAAWVLLSLTEPGLGNFIEPAWDEYFALGAMLSSLCIAFCVRYKLLD